MLKFLDPSGCTYYNGVAFAYNLPRSDQKYAVTHHPNPAEPDGKACGPGRLHLEKMLDARYAPMPWWPWWAVGIGLIGEDDAKAAYASVKLRRITKYVFWRCLRPPFNWGKGANLRRADLRWADLRWADLSEADLRWADLRWADLRWADLRRADLYGANLEGIRGINTDDKD